MKFISTSFYTISQTLFKILAGFVIIKLVAIIAGPKGVSQLGFIQNVTLIYIMLCGGIATTGITKVFAQSNINKSVFHKFNSVKEFTKKLSYLGYLFIFFPLAIYLFYSQTYTKITIIYIIIALFLTFYNARVLIFISILNGFCLIREMAKINISASLISLFLSLLFYIIYPKWQMIAISLSLGYFLVYLFIKKKNDRFFKFYNLKKDRQTNKILNKYTMFGLVSAICTPFSQIIIRTYISNNISIHDSGLWQGLLRFSEVYLILISSALSTFLIPKISSEKNSNNRNNIILKVFIISVGVSVIIMLSIYWLRNLIIVLLFNASFLGMSDLFLYQLPGDLLKVMSWVLAFSLLGIGEVKVMIILELLFSFSYVILSIFLINTNGLEGAIWAYSLNYMFYFIVILFVFGVKFGKKIISP